MILKTKPKYVTFKRKSILHRLAHILGWNGGKIKVFTDLDGRTYVGFECTCGDIFESIDITDKVGNYVPVRER